MFEHITEHVTIENLVAYLEEQPDDRVYPTGHSTSCPVASFIKETFDVPWVSAGPVACVVNDNDMYLNTDTYLNFQTPETIGDFIVLFDNLGVGTVKEARRIAREVAASI